MLHYNIIIYILVSTSMSVFGEHCSLNEHQQPVAENNFYIFFTVFSLTPEKYFARTLRLGNNVSCEWFLRRNSLLCEMVVRCGGTK